MAELYFLDKNFALTDGPLEDMTSVVWSERYFEGGIFTFHFPAKLAGRISGAVYVRSGVMPDGQVFCGRIEYLRTDPDGDCEMGGHFLECLLDDRVIAGKAHWSGTVTNAALAAVRGNLRDSSVTIGENQADIPDTVTLSGEYEPLSHWLRGVLRPYGAAYRILLNDGNVPQLQIVRGQNRSTEHTSQPVIFSASYGNIFAVETERNTADMKNAVYVEGKDGSVVLTDLSGGGVRRETYQRAGDIEPEDYPTVQAYQNALSRRGREILAGYLTDVTVRAEIDGEALPVYGRDYFLGDVCDVVDEDMGLTMPLRLTRVDWVTENGRTAVYPVFGE